MQGVRTSVDYGPCGLGARFVPLIRRAVTLTHETVKSGQVQLDATKATEGFAHPSEHLASHCSRNICKKQVAWPACDFRDTFEDFLQAGVGDSQATDFCGIHCHSCEHAAVYGRRVGKSGGNIEWCCESRRDQPAKGTSAASAGYFRLHGSWKDWLQRRHERRIHLFKELYSAKQELQEQERRFQNLHAELLQDSVAAARKTVGWASLTPLRKCFDDHEDWPGLFLEEIKVAVKHIISRALIEILLLRGNVEQNPGPPTEAYQPPRDGFVEDDMESDDEPILQRAAGARTGQVATPNRATVRPDSNPPTPRAPRSNRGCGPGGRERGRGSGFWVPRPRQNLSNEELTGCSQDVPYTDSHQAQGDQSNQAANQDSLYSNQGRGARGRGGRGRGRGRGGRGGSRGGRASAGRKGRTCVLAAALAVPEEQLEGDGPESGGVRQHGARGGSQGDSSPATPNHESPSGVTEEEVHARQIAEAKWNAAIKKEARLKPKSRADYIRGLKIYKRFCLNHGYGKEDGNWAPPVSAATRRKLKGDVDLPVWASGPRITVQRIVMAVDLVEKLNDDDLSKGVVENFCRALQFYAVVQDFLEGHHVATMDVRSINAMQELIKSAYSNTANKKIRNCADRQEGTESDGYTEEEKARLAEAWLTKGCRGGVGEEDEDTSVHQQTTMRGMFLASHQFCLRGDDGRNIDLPDLYMKKYPNVGPDVPLYVGGVSYMGKTNKNGRTEYFGGIRHREVKECAVGAIAFQLFQSFHVLGAPVPDFSSRGAWYNTFPLFYEHDDVTKKLTYNTQLKHFKEMYREHGIVSSKLTHAPRGASVRHAEDNGGKEAESARLGRWIYDHFRTSYLNQLPIGIMQIQAGFKDDRKSYFLPRGRVQPTDSEYPGLAKEIFPWADEELRKVKERNLTGPISQRDIAAQKFLELLIELRAVVLQDVALLQRLTPLNNHPIIHHHYFEGEIWEKFRSAVYEVCDAPPPPPELASVAPEVVAVLQDQQVQLARIQRESQASKEREQAAVQALETLQGQMTAVLSALERLVSVPPTVDAGSPSSAPSPRRPAQSTAAPEPRRTAMGFFDRPPSAPVAAAAEAALRAAAVQAAVAARSNGDQVGDESQGPAADIPSDMGPDVCPPSESAPLAAAAEAAVRAARETAPAAGEAAEVAAPRGVPVADEGVEPAPTVPTRGDPSIVAGIMEETSFDPIGSDPQPVADASLQGANNSGSEATRMEVDRTAIERRTPDSREANQGLGSGTGDTISSGEARSGQSGESEVTQEGPNGYSARGADRGPPEDGSVVPEWALKYTIGRNYTSITQYWKEWAHGQDGCPMSLREMEQVYGTRWRKGRENESKRLSKFRKITSLVEIVLRQGNNLSEAAAIKAVEDTMVARGIEPSQPWRFSEVLRESKTGPSNETSKQKQKRKGSHNVIETEAKTKRRKA